MTGKKNVLFFLIDCLRYDQVADGAVRRALMPTIDRLLTRGELRRVIAQAPATQLVLPALLGGRPPLADGGYNHGIRDRAASFVECLAAAGYDTGLMTNVVQYNRDLGFDRGFGRTVTALSNRRALKQDIQHKLLYEFELARRGEIDRATLTATIGREFGRMLDNLGRIGTDPARTPARFGALARTNRRLARAAGAEKALLAATPEAVMAKLTSVPEAFYWATLGARRPGPRLLAARVANKLYQIVGRALAHIGFDSKTFDSQELLFPRLVPDILDFMAEAGRPWFAFVHVLDLHSPRMKINQLLRTPFDVARRFARLGRWRRIARGLGGNRPLAADLALMAIDAELGRLLAAIEARGETGDTLVVVTADHGNNLPGLDPRPTQDLPRRFFRESLDIPLLVAGADGVLPPADRLIASMDVGPILLAALGVAGHPSFTGDAGGRDFVVSEHAGRGYCDVVRRDLHFAVTTARYKLFATLSGDRLEATDLYDLATDPLELRNLAQAPAAAGSRDRLLAMLWRARRELLAARGCVPPAGLGEAVRGAA